MLMIEEALAYIDKGFIIFPCHNPTTRGCSCGTPNCKSEGKHPRINNWQNGAASSDPIQVKEWWGKWPKANIGLPTGPINGFDVLDVDTAKDGDSTLAQLLVEHGALPPTIHVRTGSGGEHVWFKHTPGIKNNNHGKLGPGLDWRTVGGQVIAPPSLHRSGNTYEWEDISPLVEPPDWLPRMLGRDDDATLGSVKKRPPEYWRDIARGVSAGDRHNAVMSLAGYLLNNKTLDPRIAVALVYSYNTEYCDPPKSRDEVTNIIAYVLRKK